ncbi:hypothetical protein [Nocardia abscessus]|nr:hypothetical protein [Nocardia abscessus]
MAVQVAGTSYNDADAGLRVDFDKTLSRCDSVFLERRSPVR